jgi:glyoxylase I family protein
MVIGFDHVSVLVADLTKAAAFYECVLGLKKLPRPELGFEGVWLSLGQHQALHLMALPNPDALLGRPIHAGKDRHVALQVRDLEETKTVLARAGVAFTVSQSGRNSIFCRDPDGNGLELLG